MGRPAAALPAGVASEQTPRAQCPHSRTPTGSPEPLGKRSPHCQPCSLVIFALCVRTSLGRKTEGVAGWDPSGHPPAGPRVAP